MVVPLQILMSHPHGPPMREAFRGPFHGAAVGLGLRLRRRLGGEDQHTAAAGGRGRDPGGGRAQWSTWQHGYGMVMGISEN